MSTVPNLAPADDVVLAGLAERYRKDPNLAAWFAIGAAREALTGGRPDRARQVLDALVQLDSGTPDGEVR